MSKEQQNSEELSAHKLSLFPRTHGLKNGQTMHIRLVEERDAALCIAYLNRVSSETDFLSFGAGEFDTSIEEERALIRKFRQTENSLFLVAEVENEIVSMLSFSCGRRPRQRHAGELGISVRQEFWGTGVGRCLMEILIEWARKNSSIRKLNLLVRADNNRAIALYRKLGFLEEGRITRETQIDGKFYDTLFMGLQI
ncbi:MAG TPA: GNAT family N-acetyltransferase [Pyrinomonadaceae bacterium]|nr:GNAT family N-acetyltransferase [Pyrinomonadaceae bacterium]